MGVWPHFLLCDTVLVCGSAEWVWPSPPPSTNAGMVTIDMGVFLDIWEDQKVLPNRFQLISCAEIYRMGGGTDWVKMKEITEVLSQWSDTQKVRASSFHTSPIRTGVIDTPRGIECDWNRTESGSDLLLLWFKWGHGQHWLAWFFLVARSSVQWLPTTPTEPLLAQGVNGRYLLSLRWLSDLFIFFQLIKDSEHIANNLPPSAVCFSPVLLGFANHFHQVLCCQKYTIVPPTQHGLQSKDG